MICHIKSFLYKNESKRPREVVFFPLFILAIAFVVDMQDRVSDQLQSVTMNFVLNIFEGDKTHSRFLSQIQF